MKESKQKIFILQMLLSASLLGFLQFPAPAQALLKYVQPLSGTAPSTTRGATKHSEAGSEKNANTIPSVTLPFAMTQLTPQTRLTEAKCIPPYFYNDSILNGFRASHWLSGSCTQDYGSLSVMPVLGHLVTDPAAYAVPFKHADETATPSYYRLKLYRQQLLVEMTSTLRCGLMRFTADRDDSLYLLLTPVSDQQQGFVKIDPAQRTIYANNPAHRIYQGFGQSAGFSGHFYIRYSRPQAARGSFSGGTIYASDSIANKSQCGGFIGFYLKKGESVVLQIGTSFTSATAAAKNLSVEIGARSFEAVRAASARVWEQALSRVRVTTTDEKIKRIFYTSLYHAMQHPRLFSDADGSYPMFAGNYQVRKMRTGNYYDDFSMWDIYRAQLPLVEILRPKMAGEFVQSLVLKGEQGRWLPIFPCWNSYTAAMIGDHSTAFIASAYQKGIRNYEVKKAYELMRKNAFESAPVAEYKNGMGRRALASYLQYHYIPLEDSVPEAFHKKEQVSRTLEYAYDDYALAVMAYALGETADYAALLKRSYNYKNVFDPAVAMVRGRYSDGTWSGNFQADKRESYITEGTPRQYTFYVPQDVPGLALLLGGKLQLEAALDSLFRKNEYWHGNEPGHQIPFMYNYTASPGKTQMAVRRILQEEYSDGPGGLGGNDDAGQMSAWYVFAALGFYPVDPVSGQYQLASPLFDSVVITPENGRPLRIICHKDQPDAVLIQKIVLNGLLYDKKYIDHKLFQTGGRLEIWLSGSHLK